MEPTDHGLVPGPRRGRHEEFAVDGLVPFAVVGKGSDHVRSVVQRSGHTHKVCSACWGAQGKRAYSNPTFGNTRNNPTAPTTVTTASTAPNPMLP